MKRLTERLPNGVIRVNFIEEKENAVSRLAAIEDILCDSENEYDLERLAAVYNQRMSMRDEVSERFSLTAKIPLDRLREIAEAEREGRCVVLPCKLHDKIFYIDNGVIRETEAESFHNWISGRWKVSAHTDRMYDRWKGYEFGFSDIGEIAFLTRAEAEEALKAKEAET